MKPQNRPKTKVLLSILAPGLIFILVSCGQNSNITDKVNGSGVSSTDNQTIEKKFKVTFIELGSVNCIPCKMMQKVMNSIETKYSNDVKVVFYDVWTEEGKPYGTKYGIAAIPTQIFLDETGKEYFRHEGFFPEAELVKVLQKKGIKPI
jgi:thioredoxin 1